MHQSVLRERISIMILNLRGILKGFVNTPQLRGPKSMANLDTGERTKCDTTRSIWGLHKKSKGKSLFSFAIILHRQLQNTLPFVACFRGKKEALTEDQSTFLRVLANKKIWLNV